MEDKRTLCVIGPFDRYNYGDLLFPFVVDYFLSYYYKNIYYISTSKSKMSVFGGKDTLPINFLYLLSNKDIIIAGGESLSATWGKLSAYIYKPYGYINKYLMKLPFIGWRLDDMFGKLLLKGNTKLPLVILKDSFPLVNKVFYNSLGGKIPERYVNNHYIKKISDIEYISLRDKETYNYFFNIRKDIYLVPDSVIVISDIYPIQKLKTMINDNIIEFCQSKYILFQINKVEGLKYYREVVAILKSIIKSQKVKIALCSIGYASGHEDYIALRKIKNEFKTDEVQLFDNNCIFDIAYLIANAHYYIGSSLHGIITSMSYGIPYIGLYREKVNNYLQTWGIEELSKSFAIEDVLKILKFDRERLINKITIQTDLQKKEVYRSFARMKNNITDSSKNN